MPGVNFEVGMTDIASGAMIMTNVAMCWILTVFVLGGLDFYARKKLGGKRALGYKVLRFPNFFSLVAASGYTIIIMLLCTLKGLEVEYNTLTFLCLPFFVIWVFYLVNVIRRVKAETKGRPW